MPKALLALLLALPAGAAPALRAQSPASPDPNVVLRVSIHGESRPFHLGETIPLDLSFSSRVPGRYSIEGTDGRRVANLDESFSVAPADGAVDPLPNQVINGSFLSVEGDLGATPRTVRVDLNEWVRFVRPGEYRLVVTSHRVRTGPHDPSGASAVVAVSNPLALTIAAAAPEWQQATLDAAVAALDQPAPARPADAALARSAALDTLRFLGTPDAVRQLARHLDRETQPGANGICFLGLIGAPDRGVARAALEREVLDPDRAVGPTLFRALEIVSSRSPSLRVDEDGRHQALDRLIAALPAKHGAARTTSLVTAADEAWGGWPVTLDATARLAAELPSSFDQLPAHDRLDLLENRWAWMSGPAWLPVLRRYATADAGLNPDTVEGLAAQQLTAIALRRWYEIDPSGARPAIVAEITRPHPRFDARVLGLLRDETLPDADAALAADLAGDALPELENTASLVARYATGAILPRVLGRLDPQLGRWPCGIQDRLLAYVLRVDPGQARPRIKRVMAARGPGSSPCSRGLLTDIASLHDDPILEDLAVAGLDDPDPEVVINSASMLGAYGSARAEAPLLDHFTRWSARWAGHDADLTLTPADAGGGPRLLARAEGNGLLQPLLTGRAWLTDLERLRGLAPLARGADQQQQIARALAAWQQPPLVLHVSYLLDQPAISAQVAQYSFDSLEALRDKLAQFSAGTRFTMDVEGAATPARDATDAALRAYMTGRGLIVQ